MPCGLSGFEPHETMPFGDQRVPAFSPSNRIVTSIETSSQTVAPSIMSFSINGREVSHVCNRYRRQYRLQSYDHASPAKPRKLPAEVLDCIPILHSAMAASMPRDSSKEGSDDEALISAALAAVPACRGTSRA